MIKIITGLLLLTAGYVVAAPSPGFKQDWPSCDIDAQHDVPGKIGGSINDPLQAHISVRANVLQADISNARKARHISEIQADRLWRDINNIRTATDEYVAEQGFLSAAERASYERKLDDVAHKLCRSVQ